MTGDVEGAADIVTGAAVARAVEPEAGEGKEAAGECANCGATLIGPHCHQCGQKAQVHRTLASFGHDLVHSVLHFDGKVWRTLPLLAWNPGALTRRYVHGERAKFVSPLALFLFTVFLTYAVFSFAGPDTAGFNKALTPQEAEQAYRDDRQDLVKELADLKAEKAAATAQGEAGNEWMDAQIARTEARLKELDDTRGQQIRRTELAQRKLAMDRERALTDIKRLEARIAAAKAAGQPTDALQDELDSARLASDLMARAAAGINAQSPVKISSNYSGSTIPGAAALAEIVRQATENPALLLYKLQSNAYKFSWALIPISVPFLWLLFFWRREFKMFDHAVFVTYSITFMMLLGLIVALLMSMPQTEAVAGFLLAFIPPIHLYRQLHHAYGTTRLGALWRTVLLVVFAAAALMLFVFLILALGMSG